MEITSEMLHDIRNAVASIKAYVQIIKRRTEKNNMVEETEYLAKIDEKADQLITFINNPPTNSK
jgi:K+-sensing histidine kinase KdpD